MNLIVAGQNGEDHVILNGTDELSGTNLTLRSGYGMKNTRLCMRVSVNYRCHDSLRGSIREGDWQVIKVHVSKVLQWS